MSIVRKYYHHRKITMDIDDIYCMGKRVVKRADRLGKSLRNKKISPEDENIQILKKECIVLQNHLPKIYEKLNNRYGILVLNKQANEIKRLKINRLYDCRCFGEMLIEMGSYIRKQDSTTFWIKRSPLNHCRLTNLETCITSILLLTFIFILVVFYY